MFPWFTKQNIKRAFVDTGTAIIEAVKLLASAAFVAVGGYLLSLALELGYLGIATIGLIPASWSLMIAVIAPALLIISVPLIRAGKPIVDFILDKSGLADYARHRKIGEFFGKPKYIYAPPTKPNYNDSDYESSAGISLGIFSFSTSPKNLLTPILRFLKSPKNTILKALNYLIAKTGFHEYAASVKTSMSQQEEAQAAEDMKVILNGGNEMLDLSRKEIPELSIEEQYIRNGILERNPEFFRHYKCPKPLPILPIIVKKNIHDKIAKKQKDYLLRFSLKKLKLGFNKECDDELDLPTKVSARLVNLR